MRECHECGCDIQPGTSVRRDVEVGRTTYQSVNGMQTESQYRSVELCPQCADTHDRRVQQFQAQAVTAFKIFAIAGVVSTLGFLLVAAIIFVVFFMVF